MQSFHFTLASPGPNPSRQDAPHPHETILDPTDSFIVVPDLGADLLRVFSIDPKTSLLTEETPYSVAPGSGPRHGTFLKTDSGDTYFFLVSELANTVTSFKITYGENSLGFEKVFMSGIYGDAKTPSGAAAAECLLAVSILS